MQKTCAIILFILIATTVCSQNPRYLITLQDKNPEDNPYSLEQPEKFLSSKAIERRTKQNISYDSLDLPIAPLYIDSLLTTGVQIQNKSKWLNSIVAEIDSNMMNNLSEISFVKEIKYLAPPKNSTKTTSKKGIQEYKQTKKDWHKKLQQDNINYGSTESQIKLVNGHVLHENGFKGEGKTIAVLDGGFNKVDEMPVFDSLWANEQIHETKNFEDKSSSVFKDHDHGTYVLSILGANLPDELYGSAPKANYLLLRTEVTSSEYLVEEYNWIAAAEFADSAGADIINSSLGYSEFDDSTQNHTYEDLDGETIPISKAAQIAASRGMITVISAGNLGNNKWKYITAPADAYDILSVGASDQFGNYVSFSSKGPSTDGRIKPEVSAQGQAIFYQNTDSMIVNGSGTSFSAPIISGLAACLWQSKEESDYKDIIETIIQSSHQVNNPDTLLGYGIPDFANAAEIEYSSSEEDKITHKELKIYPNPFRDSFNIAIPDMSQQSEEINIKIISVTGRVIYKQTDSTPLKNNTLIIDELKNVSPGVYFIEIKYDKNSVLRKKIIKTQ
ncbi:MAG: S8 family serine peptidase [Bacteroidales bacterium]